MTTEFEKKVYSGLGLRPHRSDLFVYVSGGPDPNELPNLLYWRGSRM